MEQEETLGKETNSTPAEQKYFPYAFAARGSQRPENSTVCCFQRERAGRPWIPEGTRGKDEGVPDRGF